MFSIAPASCCVFAPFASICYYQSEHSEPAWLRISSAQKALAMVSAFFRVLIGTALACLVAGAVQVLFALNPSELAVAGPDRWQLAGWLALQSAAAVGLIVVPLAILIGTFCEIFAIKSFAFYIVTAIIVAIGGWAILFAGEVQGDPTLANSYAAATFLSTGFLAGIAYWLVAGRFAGGPLRRHRFRRPRDPGTGSGSDETSRSRDLDAGRRIASAASSIAKPTSQPAGGSVPATKPSTSSSGTVDPGTSGGGATSTRPGGSANARSLADRLDNAAAARAHPSAAPRGHGVIGFDGWFR